MQARLSMWRVPVRSPGLAAMPAGERAATHPAMSCTCTSVAASSLRRRASTSPALTPMAAGARSLHGWEACKGISSSCSLLTVAVHVPQRLQCAGDVWFRTCGRCFVWHQVAMVEEAHALWHDAMADQNTAVAAAGTNGGSGGGGRQRRASFRKNRRLIGNEADLRKEVWSAAGGWGQRLRRWRAVRTPAAVWRPVQVSVPSVVSTGAARGDPCPSRPCQAAGPACPSHAWPCRPANGLGHIRSHPRCRAHQPDSLASGGARRAALVALRTLTAGRHRLAAPWRAEATAPGITSSSRAGPLG